MIVLLSTCMVDFSVGLLGRRCSGTDSIDHNVAGLWEKLISNCLMLFNFLPV